MKKTIMLFTALLLGTSCFALISQAGSNKAGKLNALGSQFQASESAILKQHEDRITMVYGGADVSRRPTLATHTLTA